MKPRTHLTNASLFLLAFTTCAHAATHTTAHTTSITAHNIASFQHNITQTVFSSFSGNAYTKLDTQKASCNYGLQKTHEDPTATYGHAPMYGTAPTYGEYNDDGRAGRNGGDTFSTNTALSNIWLNWEHLNGNTKFDNFAHLDSKTNIYTFGIAGDTSDSTPNLSKWGLYTGFIKNQQETQEIAIKSQGGYFGIYNGNKIGNTGLYFTANGGVLNNKTSAAHNNDEYTNFWAGGAINATYDFAMDTTFTLQPGLSLGYTWIRGENYTSASNKIASDDFHMFEVTPALRAIKHISNGWFGALNAKYIIPLNKGGKTYVNNTPITTPQADDYHEYTISLEKSVHNFNLYINFGRRDGTYSGWIGDLNIKYIF